MRRAKNARLNDDDDVEIPDGHSVKVPVTLMDSLQRSVALDAAGYIARSPAAMTDEKISQLRAETRATYLRNLADAWKMQTRPRDQLPHDDRRAAIRPHLADPDEADVVEQERRHVTAEDVEMRRRKAHDEFKRQLSEAWKSR